MIEVKDLSIQLGDFSLRHINLAVREREYFVVLGPTGAGKTVLIECLAGLYRLPKGEIWIDGKNATSLPPEERGIGYVPQDYVLFPFLDVAGNITFGLRERDLQKGEAKEKVKALTRLLGISHVLDRDVSTLSAGEKQRVALARALAVSPRILLLDEPLSSVDVRTSKHLRLELKRYHDELGVTTIHVTHNLMEAEEVGERIAILNMGQLEQVGSQEEVFFYPESETVSDFLGAPNILNCDHYKPLGHGLMEAHCGGMTILLPYQDDGIRRIAVFPRDIYVSTRKPPGPELNRFRGIVTEIKPFPSLTRLSVKVGKNNLQAELARDLFEEMDITVGQEVFLILKLRRLRIHSSPDASSRLA
jgi:ABC-type sugar transport system ATPase subunit